MSAPQPPSGPTSSANIPTTTSTNTDPATKNPGNILVSLTPFKTVKGGASKTVANRVAILEKVSEGRESPKSPKKVSLPQQAAEDVAKLRRSNDSPPVEKQKEAEKPHSSVVLSPRKQEQSSSPPEKAPLSQQIAEAEAVANLRQSPESPPRSELAEQKEEVLPTTASSQQQNPSIRFDETVFNRFNEFSQVSAGGIQPLGGPYFLQLKHLSLTPEQIVPEKIDSILLNFKAKEIREFHFAFCDLSDAHLLALTPRMPNVRQATLVDCPFITSIVPLYRFRKLIKLEVSLPLSPSFPIQMLGNSPEELDPPPSLQEIVLNGFNITLPFCQKLAQLPELRKIDFTSCNLPDGAFLCFTRSPKLTHICIVECGVSAEAMIEFQDQRNDVVIQFDPPPLPDDAKSKENPQLSIVEQAVEVLNRDRTKAKETARENWEIENAPIQKEVATRLDLAKQGALKLRFFFIIDFLKASDPKFGSIKYHTEEEFLDYISSPTILKEELDAIVKCYSYWLIHYGYKEWTIEYLAERSRWMEADLILQSIQNAYGVTERVVKHLSEKGYFMATRKSATPATPAQLIKYLNAASDSSNYARLTNFNFSHLNLTYVPNFICEATWPRLLRVDLSFNRLYELPPYDVPVNKDIGAPRDEPNPFFYGARQLQVMNLQHNHLKKVPIPWEHWAFIQKIHLDFNNMQASDLFELFSFVDPNPSESRSLISRLLFSQAPRRTIVELPFITELSCRSNQISHTMIIKNGTLVEDTDLAEKMREFFQQIREFQNSRLRTIEETKRMVELSKMLVEAAQALQKSPDYHDALQQASACCSSLAILPQKREALQHDFIIDVRDNPAPFFIFPSDLPKGLQALTGHASTQSDKERKSAPSDLPKGAGVPADGASKPGEEEKKSHK